MPTFKISTIQLPPGHYKVLIELRDIPEEELLSTAKYVTEFDYWIEEIERQRNNPPSGGDIPVEVELCTATFVPSQEEIKPQILKSDRHISRGEKHRIKAGEITEESLIHNSLIMSEEDWKRDSEL